MASNRDPKDLGTPGHKEWEEFRASFSAAHMLIWLLRWLEENDRDFPSELGNWFDAGFDAAPVFREDMQTGELGAFDHLDEMVPMPLLLSADFYEGVEWMWEDEVDSLHGQLFPHGRDPREFWSTARGLVLVGLRSALESYAKSIGAHRRGPLATSIETFVEGAGNELDSKTADVLVEADETRNLIVHNRGIVDDRYVNNVKYNRFHQGERRELTRDELMGIKSAIWRAAELLRVSSAPFAE